MSVQLSANGAGLGGAVADLSGHWSATTTSLSDGTYTVRAVTLDRWQPQRDVAGHAAHDRDSPARGPRRRLGHAAARQQHDDLSSPVVTGTAASDSDAYGYPAAPVVVVDPSKGVEAHRPNETGERRAFLHELHEPEQAVSPRRGEAAYQRQDLGRAGHEL